MRPSPPSFIAAWNSIPRSPSAIPSWSSARTRPCPSNSCALPEFLRLARTRIPTPSSYARAGCTAGSDPKFFPPTRSSRQPIWNLWHASSWTSSCRRAPPASAIPAGAARPIHQRLSAQRLMHSMVLFQHSWKDCLDEYLCGKQRETAWYPPVNQAARTYKW